MLASCDVTNCLLRELLRSAQYGGRLCFMDTCACNRVVSALFNMPLELNDLQRLQQCHRVAHAALWGAKSVQSRESTASFFKFCKEPAKGNAWEINVRKKDWCASDTPVLCSMHFTAYNYNDDERLLGEFSMPVKKPRLRLDTVPTVFLHRSVFQAKCWGAFAKCQKERGKCICR